MGKRAKWGVFSGLVGLMALVLVGASANAGDGKVPRPVTSGADVSSTQVEIKNHCKGGHWVQVMTQARHDAGCELCGAKPPECFDVCIVSTYLKKDGEKGHTATFTIPSEPTGCQWIAGIWPVTSLGGYFNNFKGGDTVTLSNGTDFPYTCEPFQVTSTATEKRGDTTPGAWTRESAENPRPQCEPC